PGPVRHQRRRVQADSRRGVGRERVVSGAQAESDEAIFAETLLSDVLHALAGRKRAGRFRIGRTGRRPVRLPARACLERRDAYSRRQRHICAAPRRVVFGDRLVPIRASRGSTSRGRSQRRRVHDRSPRHTRTQQLSAAGVEDGGHFGGQDDRDDRCATHRGPHGRVQPAGCDQCDAVESRVRTRRRQSGGGVQPADSRRESQAAAVRCALQVLVGAAREPPLPPPGAANRTVRCGSNGRPQMETGNAGMKQTIVLAVLLSSVIAAPEWQTTPAVDPLDGLVQSYLWPASDADRRAAEASVKADGSLVSLSRERFHDLEEAMRRGRAVYPPAPARVNDRFPVGELIVDVPAGPRVPVLVQLPSRYDPRAEWPLMFAMHGGPPATVAQARAGAERMLRVWADTADHAGWIVAAPALTPSVVAGTRTEQHLPYELFHPEQARAVIAALRARYRINP